MPSPLDALQCEGGTSPQLAENLNSHQALKCGNLNFMGSDVYLHVDLILAALIGRNDKALEKIIAEAERGEQHLMILEAALYYAFCSLQSDDRPNFPRFCRLLQVTRVVPSPRPFDPPDPEEIANWRAVALGIENPDTSES